MATIITKNSSTASSVPLAASLTQGELAVNVTDKKLYSKDSGGNVVLISGDVTLTGTQTLTNKTLTSPTINTGVLSNPTVTNYVETLFTANTSTAITVSLANGTVQQLTLTGNATITMPAQGAGKSFIIMLKQDATGSRSVTWSTVTWPAGTAPTITGTASKQDIYSFFSDGTNWYGSSIGQNY